MNETLTTFAKSPDYSADNLRPALESALTPILFACGGVSGKKLMLKPNLLSYRHRGSPAAVAPEFLLATCRLLQDAGAKSLTIIENPGMSTAPAILRAMGIDKTLTDMGVEYKNCEKYQKTPLPPGCAFREIEIAREFEEFDHVVNIAKLKTHAMMTLTLATKNLFGLIRGSERIGWHLAVGRNYARFAEMLLAIKALVEPRINLVDGVVAMEGNGPGSGDPKNLGVIAAGTDALALDDAIAKLLNVKLILLDKAREKGLVPTYETLSLPEGEFSLKLPDEKLPSLEWGVWLPKFLRGFLQRAVTGRPEVAAEKCVSCGKCVDVCPPKSLKLKDGKPEFDLPNCIRCYCCQEHCPQGAITLKTTTGMRVLSRLEKILRLR